MPGALDQPTSARHSGAVAPLGSSLCVVPVGFEHAGFGVIPTHDRVLAVAAIALLVLLVHLRRERIAKEADMRAGNLMLAPDRRRRMTTGEQLVLVILAMTAASLVGNPAALSIAATVASRIGAVVDGVTDRVLLVAAVALATLMVVQRRERHADERIPPGADLPPELDDRRRRLTPRQRLLLIAGVTIIAIVAIHPVAMLAVAVFVFPPGLVLVWLMGATRDLLRSRS